MIRRAFLALLLVSLMATGLTAGGRWEVLGERQVNDRLDHDTIMVTGAKGTFKSIRLEVRRHSVDFHRVVIHFADGEDQRVEMRHTIPAGGETRAIDLEGRNRIIRSIDLWYDANTLRHGGSATVFVTGRH